MHAGDAEASMEHRAQALTWYLAASGVMRKLTDRDPANGNWRISLAQSLSRVAEIENLLHLRDDAQKNLRAAQAIYARGVEEAPDNLRIRAGLAVMETDLGDLEAEAGDVAAAKAYYEEAIRSQEELVRRAPQTLDFQTDLAQSHNSLGMLLGKNRTTTATARTHLERTLAILLPLQAGGRLAAEFQPLIRAAQAKLRELKP
jgi:tetratricopeptide (TPR) repeat protein